MLLRPAVDTDAEAIAVLFRASRRQAMPWLPDLHTPDEDLAWVRGTVLPTLSVELAEQDGRTVAACATGDGTVEHLYVAPDAQGRGTGRALLDAAKERSAGTLRLWVFARNARARRFYAAAGFVEVGATDGDNEEGLPDVLLEWVRG